mgnify:CR=1 FL=1
MRFFADRFPDLSPFYKEHWENGKYYAENDEIVLKSDSFADHYLGLKNFQGEDNVELLVRAKFEYSLYKQGLMMVRGSSFIDPNTKQRVTTGYVLSVFHENGAQRLRLDDNIYRGLEVYSDKTLRAGVWTWFRFRVEGSWLKAKAWEDGAQEPSGWDIAVSNSRWEYNSKGANGLSMAAGGTVRVNVLSASALPLPAVKPEDFNPSPQPYTLTSDFATGAPIGGFPAGGAYIPVDNKPKVYTLTGSRAAERLTISRPILTVNGPTYSLRGNRGWAHLVFKKKPTLTYSPPKPGELRPVQVTERLIIRPPVLSHTGPVYALKPSRITERINISSPTLTAYTAALMQPEGVLLRVGISSPSVIFVPKPEVLTLKPAPLALRLTITRTNDLLDPSVYNIEYKQYKPGYTDTSIYIAETLNIDRYRPDTIETGKIDSIELETNRYKQIVIK